MSSFVFFILQSIASSIIGSATESWFRKTKLGNWLYKKIDLFFSWSSSKYSLSLLKKEKNFYRNYPHLVDRIEKLEKEVFKNEQ